MMDKKASVLKLLALFLLLILLVYAGYFVYENIPGKGILLNPRFSGGELQVLNLSGEVSQFYPNMRFNKNQLYYYINPECNQEKANRMISAFNTISEKTAVLVFSQMANPNDADIKVSCSDELQPPDDSGTYIVGKGGGTEAIKTIRYTIPIGGEIILYNSRMDCDWPIVELHELLHVLGFDHSNNSNSIMHSSLTSCSQVVDESIINNLKTLYLQEALSDLYFENASAVKKGRYFDFNVSVKNSGLIDAENVILGVYDGNERIDEFELGDISIGAGTSLMITNLKLSSRSSSMIILKIDDENVIREIDETNNNVELNVE